MTVMAINPEAEVKALRARVDGLERKIDSLEKTMRALPDLAAIAKLGSRLDAAEKAIAGKKDAKTSEQEADKSNAKLVAEMQALAKEQTSKAVLEARFKVLEAHVAVAMAGMGKR
jgi:predicted  nucleic acid-binding Zn-ribbon protein